MNWSSSIPHSTLLKHMLVCFIMFYLYFYIIKSETRTAPYFGLYTDGYVHGREMNISKQNLYHHVSSMVSVRGWGSRSVRKNNNSWLVLLHSAALLEHVFTLTAVCLSTVCDIWHVHSCQKHKASESLLLNTKQIHLFLSLFRL